MPTPYSVPRLFWLTLLTGGTLLLSACGSEPPPPAPTAAAVPAAATPADAALDKLYTVSCKTCHGVAGTGAPLTGDTAAWQPRVAKGIDTLLDHTIAGFQTMPPMGLCPQCSAEEFEQLIEFMSGTTFD